MSLAEDTRQAVRRRPFLLAALRADVVNYTAAARFLSDDLDGSRVARADADAVATALRRFADGLSPLDSEDREARVEMRSGLGETDGGDGPLAVGGTTFAPGSGSLTGIVATGDVDPGALSQVLQRLLTADVDVAAAGVSEEALVVVVDRRDGATAVRTVERALSGVRRPPADAI